MLSEFSDSFWEEVNEKCNADILTAVMDFKFNRITAQDLAEYIAYRCEVSARMAREKEMTDYVTISKAEIEALPKYWADNIGDEVIKVDDLRALLDKALRP